MVAQNIFSFSCGCEKKKEKNFQKVRFCHQTELRGSFFLLFILFHLLAQAIRNINSNKQMVLIPKITDQFYFTSISNLDRFNNLLPTLNLPLCKKYKMKKKTQIKT